MEAKSFEVRLGQLLKDAKVEHGVAVLNQEATDEDWPKWYAHYIAQKLTPMLTTVSGSWVNPKRLRDEAEAYQAAVNGSAVRYSEQNARLANCHDTDNC